MINREVNCGCLRSYRYYPGSEPSPYLIRGRSPATGPESGGFLGGQFKVAGFRVKPGMTIGGTGGFIRRNGDLALPPVQRKHEVQVEARQVNIGRVHVGRMVMPGPMMAAGPVTAHVVLMPARALPVMSVFIGPSPMTPVPVVPTPVRAASMVPVPVMSAPVRSVPMMHVSVLRGLLSRACGCHHWYREEERQAGSDQSVESFP